MASPSNSKFTYDDLTEESARLSRIRDSLLKGLKFLSRRRKFRYLTLHPGRGKDRLTCNLHTSRFRDAPPYEAISYVWGSDKLDHPVVCNGKEMHITRNLSMVLRRLRLPYATRILWADSICINQADIEEKSQQVALMSDIYRSAFCVLIYMGEDFEQHGQPVRSFVNELTSMIDNVMQKIDTSAWNTFTYWEFMTFANDSRWSSFQALLDQDWFARGWVVREAALAQRGRVIWGQSSFGWDRLMQALLWLLVRGRHIANVQRVTFQRVQIHLDAFADQHISRLKCLHDESYWYRGSLLDFLKVGRTLHMSDPRDRLFAFLDISTDESRQVEIDPKYSGTPLEVYHDLQ